MEEIEHLRDDIYVGHRPHHVVQEQRKSRRHLIIVVAILLLAYLVFI